MTVAHPNTQIFGEVGLEDYGRWRTENNMPLIDEGSGWNVKD